MSTPLACLKYWCYILKNAAILEYKWIYVTTQYMVYIYIVANYFLDEICKSAYFPLAVNGQQAK